MQCSVIPLFSDGKTDVCMNAVICPSPLSQKPAGGSSCVLAVIVLEWPVPWGQSEAVGLNSGDPGPSTSQLFCLQDLPCFEAEGLPEVLGWLKVSGRGPVAACLHGGLRIQFQPLSLQLGKPSSRQERVSCCQRWWQDLPSFPLS